MNKIIVFFLLILLISSVSFLLYDEESTDVKLEEGIDTGITVEQTWRIINGDDISEVLNLRRINNSGNT